MNTCVILNHEVNITSECVIVPWWSIAKTVIATAIFKLVEQKKLSLDKNYFDLDGTLGQILRHESGLKDYSMLKEYHESVDQKKEPWNPDEMIEKSNISQLLFKEGEGWSYSNIGYYYVRRLIETVTNLDLEDALNELIFNDLTITDVIVAKDKEDLNRCTEGVLDGYHPGWVYHGMLVGSLKSACIFLDELSRGNILKSSSLDKMKEAYVLNFDIGDRPWKVPSYSFGMMVDNQKGKLYSFGHTGAGPGSVIAVYHFPNMELPITIGAVCSSNDESLVEKKIIEILNNKKSIQ